MVVPIARRRKTYIYHIPLKVGGTIRNIFSPAKISQFSLSLILTLSLEVHQQTPHRWPICYLPLVGYIEAIWMTSTTDDFGIISCNSFALLDNSTCITRCSSPPPSPSLSNFLLSIIISDSFSVYYFHFNIFNSQFISHQSLFNF